MKIYCYWTSFGISFIWFAVLRNLWFLMWSVPWTDFCIINLRRPPGGLFTKFIPFVQMLFGELFSYYRTAKKRTKWSLTEHSWNLTDLKIIGLSLSSFYIEFTTFILLSQRCRVAKKLLEFLFSDCFCSLCNIPKKSQGIRSGSWVISFRHQWVYICLHYFTAQ